MYESRLIIGRKIKHARKSARVFFQELCRYELCSMGNQEINYKNFFELFDQEVDFEMFVEDENQATKTDRYGDICKYTTQDHLLPWLNLFTYYDGYWRIPPLIALLEALKEEKDLIIIHYGH